MGFDSGIARRAHVLRVTDPRAGDLARPLDDCVAPVCAGHWANSTGLPGKYLRLQTFIPRRFTPKPAGYRTKSVAFASKNEILTAISTI